MRVCDVNIAVFNFFAIIYCICNDYNVLCFSFQAACLWRRALLASLEFNRIIPPSFARRLGRHHYNRLYNNMIIIICACIFVSGVNVML